jgi:transcriptional regulator with XRE-family HTH domain
VAQCNRFVAWIFEMLWHDKGCKGVGRMNIGEALQKVRQSRDLTQQEVASQMYVTRQTISRWEQGKTMPNIYALQDLAKLYHVSLDELVGPQILKSKGEAGTKQMKKINWLALFGLFWFNVIVMLGVVLAVAGILFGLWLSIGLFAISPLLLVIEWILVHMDVLTQPSNLSIFQAILSIIICAVGIGACPLVKNFTFYCVEFFKRYWRYNIKSVYA